MKQAVEELALGNLTQTANNIANSVMESIEQKYHGQLSIEIFCTILFNFYYQP